MTETQACDEIEALAAQVHQDGIIIDHVTDLVLSLFPLGHRQHLALSARRLRLALLEARRKRYPRSLEY